MSTDKLADITSTLPNRRTPLVTNPDVRTNEKTVPVADAERQEIAVGSAFGSNDPPVNQVAESPETQSQEGRLESAVEDINSDVPNVHRKI